MSDGWETTCGCWDYADTIAVAGSKRPIMWLDGADMVGCATCHRCADYLCDFPLGKGKTCDAALCADHAFPQGEHGADLHFCPTHAVMSARLVQDQFPVSAIEGGGA